MNTMEGEMLHELLDLDVDGQLEASEKARLSQLLEADGSLGDEHRCLEALHVLMREDTIPVRPGFKGQVLSQLPVAAWEPQANRLPAWAMPVAMMLTLGVAASLVLGTGMTAEGSALLGTGLAIFDFLQVTALTGAGLLTASWRGFGLGLEEMIATSGMSLAAMSVFVVFMNLLFFSMLRRRGREPAKQTVSK